MATSQAAESPSTKTPLNDVLIAMDVVDTIRHDKDLVERELNDDVRRKDLIDRLREIYRGQGIEVPDAILEDGVKALEEGRFTYTPPPAGNLSTRLAKLYVTRGQWGRYVGGAVAAVALAWLGNYVVFERPKLLEQQAVVSELKERIPASLGKLSKDIATEARDPAIAASADALVKQGLNAASSANLKEARAAEVALTDTLQQLRAVYEIKIINRRGEVSGLWRIPRSNPNAYNYYLVVEAIGGDGKPVPLWITNEETGRREMVNTWGVRVPREVLERVRIDKQDDGIIQNAVVGRKERGLITPTWSIKTLGGAITKWN